MKKHITRVKRTIFLEASKAVQSIFPLGKGTDLAPFNAKTAVSRQYRYVYYGIPKAANTTIVYSLYVFELGLSEDNPQNLRFVKDSYFMKLPQFKEEEVKEIQESWFKFAVVRNPYSRILSAYRDKIIGVNTKSQYVNRFLGRPIDDPISFDQFLYYLERGGIKLNPHWAPQTTLLSEDITTLDYLGKLESLEKDFLHISTSIYGRPAPLRFASHKQTGSTLSNPLLTEANKKRIKKLYHADFEAFSYPCRVEFLL